MLKKASYLASFFFANMMHLSAADQPVTVAPDQGISQTLVMVGIALAFFYFILWRPEQKRRKALDSQRSGMKKGDRVICMGIVGTISKIKEDTVVIRSAGAELEFLKAAISEVQPGSSISSSTNEEERTKPE